MSNRQLVRVDFVSPPRSVWRPLISLEHGTLCHQFSLDPATYYFDLPDSARGTGSASSGNRAGRVIDGYVMHGPTRKPIARIRFATESERFRDVDPTDPRETLRLG